MSALDPEDAYGRVVMQQCTWALLLQPQRVKNSPFGLYKLSATFPQSHFFDIKEMPRHTDAQLNFIQLLHKVTGDHASWSPQGAKMKVGDYGTVERGSGAFLYEGSIYHIPELWESCPMPVPADYRDGDQFIVATKNGRKFDFPVELSSNIPAIASASIKGRWQFGDESGAILIVEQPRHRSLPYGTIMSNVMKHSLLQGKSLVTEVVTCPAYARYSHDQAGGEVSLALTGSITIPHTPASVKVDVSPKWIHEESCGIFDCGTQGLPHPGGRRTVDREAYTVMYTLLDCKEPEPEGWSLFPGSPLVRSLSPGGRSSNSGSRKASPTPSRPVSPLQLLIPNCESPPTAVERISDSTRVSSKTLSDIALIRRALTEKTL